MIDELLEAIMEIPAEFIIFIIIFILIAVDTLVFSIRCRKCKRYFALSKTGEERNEGEEEEWRCKYCEHREWKAVNDDANDDPGAWAE